MKKSNSVTASRFLSWYFSDYSEVHSFGVRCMEMLESDGFVNISAEQLFDECGYIPQSICEDYDGVYEVEYEPSDVEFINDIK
tara:strand:+ start:1821 stop:2069 length:249 start_codon:yes stop_codon:yes gene_type:complete